jgi:2-polyprenyl-3-methyl-5-hydroxy-6-metoxy-1,4-benzoquinol methylase
MASKESNYDPEWTAAHYDEYGEKEWERLSSSPADKISYYIHDHYLREFVRSGYRVLEIGAGPGMLTKVLADIGCSVLVGDISRVQLDLHKKHSEELGFSSAVEDRRQLDVCDLGSLDTNSFDAVVCIGGALSYVFDRVETAMAECVRVCKPGGHVLMSVMSLWGSCHRYLEAVLNIPAENNRKITDTGDLLPENWDGVAHRCHMFRSAEVKELALKAGLEVVALSAANSLSIGWDEYLNTLAEDSDAWRELLRMELEACSCEGLLDSGTHILLVGRKSA